MLSKQALAKILAEKVKTGALAPRSPGMGGMGMGSPGIKPSPAPSMNANTPLNAPLMSTDPMNNLQSNAPAAPQIDLAKKGLKQYRFPNLMKTMKPSPNA